MLPSGDALPEIQMQKFNEISKKMQNTFLSNGAGFITTPRSTDLPIDHKICGRFNASVGTTTLFGQMVTPSVEIIVTIKGS